MLSLLRCDWWGSPCVCVADCVFSSVSACALCSLPCPDWVFLFPDGLHVCRLCGFAALSYALCLWVRCLFHVKASWFWFWCVVVACARYLWWCHSIGFWCLAWPAPYFVPVLLSVVRHLASVSLLCVHLLRVLVRSVSSGGFVLLFPVLSLSLVLSRLSLACSALSLSVSRSRARLSRLGVCPRVSALLGFWCGPFVGCLVSRACLAHQEKEGR